MHEFDCVCVYMFVDILVCVCVYVYIYIYNLYSVCMCIYIYTHRQKCMYNYLEYTSILSVLLHMYTCIFSIFFHSHKLHVCCILICRCMQNHNDTIKTSNTVL